MNQEKGIKPFRNSDGVPLASGNVLQPAIFAAVLKCNGPCVKILLEYGADIEARDILSRSLLSLDLSHTVNLIFALKC